MLHCNMRMAALRSERWRSGQPLVTCHQEFPPEWIRVRPIEDGLMKTIYGRADYRSVEGAGGWSESG
jgi:hypothetical protein